MPDLYQTTESVVEDFKNSTIEIAEGLSFQTYKHITKIAYYSHSEYLSGMYDDLGREKPFLNVINSAVNLGVRATDMDTKDVQLEALHPKYFVQSFFARKELMQWMSDMRFDITLNKMSETRVRYGTALIKRTIKQDGKLNIEVVPWGNVYVDQVDIANNPIVEVHYMSRLDLIRMRGSWKGLSDNWDDVMSIFDDIERGQEDGDQSITNRIEVMEIQGELDKFYIDEDAEDWDVSLQKHYLVNYGEDKQFTFHSEELKDGVNYRVLDWEEVEKRGIARGMAEDGFQAQKWINDSVIRENEVMEIASKLLFKSNDDLIYDNALTDLDNGSIIKLKNGDISTVNTLPNSMPEFEQNKQSWQNQYTKATSTYPGITGEQQPANTPLGSVQLQNSEARSIFDYRREQMGIFIEDMIEDWVLPHLMKQLNKEHILNSDFTQDELDMIDTAFATYEANKRGVEKILDNPKKFTALSYQEEVNGLREKLQKGKDRRYVEIPKDFFKGMEAKVRIVTTNEKYNKQAVLQSMTQLLSLAPTLKEQPELLPIFARAIEMSGIGISPIEVTQAMRPSPLDLGQPAPQGGGISANQAEKVGEALGANTSQNG